MKVTAIVMAGGKGSRMAISEEKPLLKIGGKPAVLHVLDALKNANKVDNIVVATSDQTPKTAKFLRELHFRVINTPGNEYVSDLAYAVKTLNLETILSIAADMPFITGKIIDKIIDQCIACRKPALAVAVPLETKQKLGMSANYAFELKGKLVVPAGINMIKGSHIDEKELEQEVLIVDSPEVATNINTLKELLLAQEQFSKIQKITE